MYTQRGFPSCDGILKYKLKVGLVVGCAHIGMVTVTFKIKFV